MSSVPASAAAPASPSFRKVVAYFFRLGWLAFGGPVGQLGLMHADCVEGRGWLTEEEFLQALNFCHVLPGPEALQMAIYIGYRLRRYVGGIVAGILFILPGYLTLTALGWVYVRYGTAAPVLNVLWGFRPVALALLLSAMLRIGRAALKTAPQAALAVLAFIAFFVLHIGFVYVLLGCGLAHLLWGRAPRSARGLGTGAGLWVLLHGAPAQALSPGLQRIASISWFFLKVGLVSFGGAYAVLPLFREGAVGHYGWLTDAQMVDALALGETTPGPLISIGVFIGYLAGSGVGHAIGGATAAMFWLFLPSFVFVLLGAPHFERLTRPAAVKQFLGGVTAGVVGLMASVAVLLGRAAFTVGGHVDWLTVLLGAVAFATLLTWKWRLNVVVVVLAGGLLGLGRALLGS